MAKGKVTVTNLAAPSHGALSENFAGQNAVALLLDEQTGVAPRSLVRRVFGSSPLTPVTRVLYENALAELTVGEAFDNLVPEWITVHAVPVASGQTTLDHLVVGPGGVFVIDTRSHVGQAVWASQRTFMVSGIRYPHIRNMEYEMGRVERLLGAASIGAVEVSGILVVVDPKSLTVRHKHRDVAVLRSTELETWLRERRRVLSDADVQRIGAAAQTPATWTDDFSNSVDLAQLSESFTSLRVSVRSAWRRQVIWVTVFTALGAGGFALLTSMIMANALAAFGG